MFQSAQPGQHGLDLVRGQFVFLQQPAAFRRQFRRFCAQLGVLALEPLELAQQLIELEFEFLQIGLAHDHGNGGKRRATIGPARQAVQLAPGLATMSAIVPVHKSGTMVKVADYVRRRRRLMQQLGKGSIAIVPSAQEIIRSRDTHFRFRQDSDFGYLTGFPEPNAVLVLIPGRPQGETVLFCNERDPLAETWHGRRYGPERAAAAFQFDDAFPIDDIDEILPGLMEGRDRIHYALGQNPDFDNTVMGWLNALRAQVRKGVHPPGEIIDLRHQLHDMRLFKDAAELKQMRAAAHAAAQGHIRAMRAAKPGVNEAQIAAELSYEFARHGAHHCAYNSIVAGGDNACILHYVENNMALKDGDLLLVDAGAEYEWYASDITRTFPVNGKFSALQRRCYEWVLKAQQAAIEQVKPGNTWNQIHDAAVRTLTQGLIDLGVLKGKLSDLLDGEAYKPYYMHKTGHWLGLDVHDVGDYQIDGQPRVLEPGMVLTVEPGLYFAPGTKGLAKKFHGIGIRIEDDVLVTKTGFEVLTTGVPKDPDEIEALMAA